MDNLDFGLLTCYNKGNTTKEVLTMHFDMRAGIAPRLLLPTRCGYDCVQSAFLCEAALPLEKIGRLTKRPC